MQPVRIAASRRIVYSVCVGLGLVFAAPGARAQFEEVPVSENQDGRVDQCLGTLKSRYGVAEIGEVQPRRNYGQRWVIAQVTLEDGTKSSFRCQIRYGTLRGVEQYDGTWNDVEPGPVPPEDERPEEFLRLEGKDPEAVAEGEGEGGGEGAEVGEIAEAEPETEDGAGEETEAAEFGLFGAAGDDPGGLTGFEDQAVTGFSAPGVSDFFEPEAEEETADGDAAEDGTETAEGDLAEPETTRPDGAVGYSPADGVTCFEDRGACYNENGSINLSVTGTEFGG